MPTTTVVTSLDALRRSWPDLRDAAVVRLDLRDVELDWSTVRLDRSMWFDCRLAAGDVEVVVARGGAVVAGLDDLPFAPYRAELYAYDELAAVVDGRSTTYDERVGAWYRASSPGVHDGAVRALHDATIDDAVARFVAGRRVVGVMGGHAVARDAPLYGEIASLGRALTRAGFCVATGGGPGVMEAANFGAWFARYDDAAVADAMTMLAATPAYGDDPRAYVTRALTVRDRWPEASESLGVPTWVYLDEPTTAFATHIAKYFTNSLREDGLLAVARAGVVYAPGGPGTEQEIFTDAAQNSLTLYEVRSPMVFLGAEHYERRRPELVRAVRRQAAEFGWDHLVAVCDTVDDAVEFVRANDPGDAAKATVDRRRTHRQRR